MIKRRSFIKGALASTIGLASARTACAQDRGLPPAVQKALGRYRGSKVSSVRIRQGAPTAQGFMYEVALRGPEQSERIIYVDPDNGRILYETDAAGR